MLSPKCWLSARSRNFNTANGKRCARLTIGFAGTLDSAQTRHLGARGVAVQDLQNKQMHRGRGIQYTVTPHMTDGSAHFLDQARTKKLSNIGLDLLHGSEDTTSHPWPPVCNKVVAPLFWQEADFFFQISCKELSG